MARKKNDLYQRRPKSCEIVEDFRGVYLGIDGKYLKLVIDLWFCQYLSTFCGLFFNIDLLTIRFRITDVRGVFPEEAKVCINETQLMLQKNVFCGYFRGKNFQRVDFRSNVSSVGCLTFLFPFYSLSVLFARCAVRYSGCRIFFLTEAKIKRRES